MFLQNYRPGVAERLGMDYETIRGDQPARRLRLDLRVRRDRPVRDAAGPGPAAPGDERGDVSAPAAPATPQPAGTYVDAITAYSAFEGALAALLHRERTGEGQLVR